MTFSTLYHIKSMIGNLIWEKNACFLIIKDLQTWRQAKNFIWPAKLSFDPLDRTTNR